ncbi:hypothetical protein FGB62_37g121 [Gracilaria domingensis]|nr:hypothetical protein FGB62_37g121 [Gracilaria domingensis]
MRMQSRPTPGNSTASPKPTASGSSSTIPVCCSKKSLREAATMMLSILLLAFCAIPVASLDASVRTSSIKQRYGLVNAWTAATKRQDVSIDQRPAKSTSKRIPSRSVMEALHKGIHLCHERKSAMSKQFSSFSPLTHLAKTKEFQHISDKQISNTDSPMGAPSLSMTMASLNMAMTGTNANGLNFEGCALDTDCLGDRTCIELGDSEVISCAGGDCFCLSADPICFSSFQCSPGEFCEDDTGFCVASSTVIGTELNGEACLESSNCSPTRTCIQISADGSSALCSGLDCFCTTEDPSCATELDCDAGESCLSIDGVLICLANAVLPIAPLSLSAQPCQQDTDCLDPSTRVCAQVQSSLPIQACDGGRCACLPLIGCLDSIECFIGETCEMDEGGGICVQDGTLLPPTQVGLNFEPCATNDDCEAFRTCIEFVPFGAGVAPISCQGDSCFCLTESPGCSGPNSLECSFGESCFTSDGVNFSCTSDFIIPFLEPA